MNIEFSTISRYLSSCINQKNGYILTALALISALYFFLKKTQSIDPSRIQTLSKKNFNAIKQKWYLTRILFRGSLEKQEEIARNMARDLEIPFHLFDGRNLKGNIEEFNQVLQQISKSQTPQFVFVSYADEICRSDKSTLNTILAWTGSASQKLLLCIGVSSHELLPPALASRYREQIIIGE